MIKTLSVSVAPTVKDLTLLATIKSELSISGTADDAWLTDAIRQASDAAAAYCARPEGFGRATLVETWRAQSGNCADVLVLSRDLLPEIASVVEDGTTLDAADYLLDGSLLRRLSGDAPSEWRAVKTVVTYDAGWELLADVPFDVERCCIDLVVRAYNGRGRDPGLRSERILDVISQSWDTPGGDGFKGGLPRDVAERLDRYVRYA